MRDSKNLTDQVEGFDPPTCEQKEAARKTVCAFATDVDDAAMLMSMLGIHPLASDDDEYTVALISRIVPVAL